MKKLFILFIFSFNVALVAQTHEIITHDNKKMDVNFIKMDNNLVYFAVPGSSEEKKISQYAVAQLNKKSANDSKLVSKKINVLGKSDYKKVIVLKDSQTIGLKKSGVITSFYGKTKGETNTSFLDGGEKRLKEHAALKGCPFIVIMSNTPNDIKAITYTY
ncbi:hypothetical protein EKM02_10850 [Flavobacterium sp. RSP49]|uniref:hypothetical protein n=1 Tax=Flavobacterium sp. RSP49 TaxID=2497487 RepID=UPI000F82F780|nr:hypothetical protein [Flavobacterium sp. RSP49]RTY99049.1 hypothetical protein EKM02_10850 [Flavobacterium sp. RSP49]